MASICAAMAGEHAQTGVKAMGAGIAMASALLTARDLREASAIQNTYTLKAYEDYASTTAKLGSLWIDLFRELYSQPLNGRGV